MISFSEKEVNLKEHEKRNWEVDDAAAACYLIRSISSNC